MRKIQTIAAISVFAILFAQDVQPKSLSPLLTYLWRSRVVPLV